MSNIILNCQNINKTYQDAHLKVEVIKNLNLTVKAGENIGIIGSSGSGKSTLLHLLGGLDTVTAGSVELLGKNLSQLGQAELGLWRNKYLGFVYQFHHLLPEFTALENVMMPLLIAKINKEEAKERAAVLLDKVGLKNRLEHRPSELSGGERQRAAIARALVTNPACILADEPTGNLDKGNAHNVLQLMHELKQEFNTALIIVTHDEDLVQYFSQIFHMHEGMLIQQ